jgi:hypothetical protein
LGVAPYQRLSKIKKIYKNLLKNQNSSEVEEFRKASERLKKAYDDIKSSRKVEHEEIEDNILSGLVHLLEQCFISVSLAWIFLAFIYKSISIIRILLTSYLKLIIFTIVVYNIYDVFVYHKLYWDSILVTIVIMFPVALYKEIYRKKEMCYNDKETFKSE